MTPISATAFASASQCAHTWFLENFGDASLKREPDAGLLLAFERGNEHEKRVMATLKDAVTPVWDGKDWKQGVAATTEAMRKGAEWIRQAPLAADGMRGKADLLHRIPGKSKCGEFSYEPVDIKGHAEVTKKDRFQVYVYGTLLEPVLGHRPGRGGVWLNTMEIEYFDLADDEADARVLLERMKGIGEGNVQTTGFRCTACATCAWMEVCSEQWKTEKSVCLIAGVSAKAAARLAESGFGSWKDISNVDLPEFEQRVDWMAEEKARDVWLSAKAWSTGLPQPKRRVRFPTDRPRIFWDIETHGSVVYLHGAVRLAGDERTVVQFFADSPDSEKSVWVEFLSWLAATPDAVLYAWSGYELGNARRLFEKYGGKDAGWRVIQRCLVDQCRFTKAHFALPAVSYSIKKVAPVFGFSWSAKDAGGLNSEAWYGEWLKNGDAALREKILRYNLDDVVAMEVIDRELRKICAGLARKKGCK